MYRLNLWMLEEHNCLISTSYQFPMLSSREHALRIDHSPTFSKITQGDNICELCLWIIEEHSCLINTLACVNE